MQMGSSSKRAIMIDGWADWCAACKKMDNSTFRNQKIIAKLHNNWVAVKFDFTQLTDENEKLAEKYGMPGLPTLILLPPNGELSKAKKLTGYISATRLYKELQDFEAKL
jgi:thiol:disulfide interchange protein DsbD